VQRQPIRVDRASAPRLALPTIDRLRTGLLRLPRRWPFRIDLVVQGRHLRHLRASLLRAPRHEDQELRKSPLSGVCELVDMIN
jgi:hypothetical protein